LNKHHATTYLLDWIKRQRTRYQIPDMRLPHSDHGKALLGIAELPFLFLLLLWRGYRPFCELVNNSDKNIFAYARRNLLILYVRVKITIN
ncbi:MAG: hypothetical protein P8Y28_12165, partial [Gammaproteobacteria bacterium]